MSNCARYDAICVHYTYIIDFLQLDIHMNPRQYKPIYHKQLAVREEYQRQRIEELHARYEDNQ